MCRSAGGVDLSRCLGLSTFLTPGTGFMVDNFSKDEGWVEVVGVGEWGCFQDETVPPRIIRN